MKKLAIAGASVALAAMPVMGVFATDITSITDTLEITVEATCTFNTADSSVASNASYSATVANGAVASFNSGANTHKFNVFCNDTDGWKVTAGSPNDLTPPAAHTTNLHKITYQNSAIPAAGGGTKEGAWTATVSGTGVTEGLSGLVTTGGVNYIKAATTGETPVAGGGIIATNNASTDGSTFTVTYAAYVGTETAADTYTGTIGYTLAAL